MSSIAATRPPFRPLDRVISSNGCIGIVQRLVRGRHAWLVRVRWLTGYESRVSASKLHHRAAAAEVVP